MLMERETAWTRRNLLDEAIVRLEKAGICEARRNVEWMLEEVLECSRAALYAYPEAIVASGQLQTFAGMLVRRCQHEPLQYVLGYAEFYGLRLEVTPAVLIPRPETEQVVEAALALSADVAAPRMLDVGTGSGCIAVALKHMRPDAEVYACDVSMDALAVAEQNAHAIGIGVTFACADVLDARFPVQLGCDGLHLLISNPPYIPLAEAGTLDVEVRRYEPELALFSGDDPLHFYRAIIRQAATLLVSGGWLVFETHADHAEGVRGLLSEAGFLAVHVARDLSGRPRIAWGQRA